LKNQRFKVLIVDDEIDICYLLSGMLRQKDFKTAYVNTLGEASVAINNDAPDIIFLDNHLPDGLGMEYIKHIKETCPETCLIMITAHDSPSEKNRALGNGADAFLGKPLTRDLIYNSLQKFIIPRPML
jgi:DNA-binding response OmpR family regulator